MRHHFPAIKGLRVLIVGDITHSRVARSNIFGLKKMGADVALCSPPTLLPYRVDELGVEISHDLDKIIGEFDVVMALRIQLERQEKGLFPSAREYRDLFGLTTDRVRRMKPKSIVMHPGPTNRGLEIDPEVADGPRSVILEQVKNGVAIRMAVLFILAGGKIE
jgi:aspartate carbamoyltransferase catalytic subunit